MPKPYNKVQLADGDILLDVSDTTAEEKDVVKGKAFTLASGAKGTGSFDTDKLYYTDDATVDKEDLPAASYVPVLAGSATKKVAVSDFGGSSKLSELEDITIASPAKGDTLFYDNTTSKWVNGPNKLKYLSDVDADSPSDGDTLVYDAASDSWKNGTPEGLYHTDDPVNHVMYDEAEFPFLETLSGATKKTELKDILNYYTSTKIPTVLEDDWDTYKDDVDSLPEYTLPNKNLISQILNSLITPETLPTLIKEDEASKTTCEFYISPSGNDTSGNGSSTKPWKTWAKFISEAKYYREATVHVGAGTYTEDVSIEHFKDLSIIKEGNIVINGKYFIKDSFVICTGAYSLTINYDGTYRPLNDNSGFYIYAGAYYQDLETTGYIINAPTARAVRLYASTLLIIGVDCTSASNQYCFMIDGCSGGLINLVTANSGSRAVYATANSSVFVGTIECNSSVPIGAMAHSGSSILMAHFKGNPQELYRISNGSSISKYNGSYSTLSSVAPANRYLNVYVSPSGSDDNSGEEVTTPYKTLARAMKEIQFMTEVNDTQYSLHIAAGTYNEEITITSKMEIRLGGDVRINGGVTINHGDVRIYPDTDVTDGIFRIYRADYSSLSNNYCLRVMNSSYYRMEGPSYYSNTASTQFTIQITNNSSFIATASTNIIAGKPTSDIINVSDNSRASFEGNVNLGSLGAGANQIHCTNGGFIFVQNPTFASTGTTMRAERGGFITSNLSSLPTGALQQSGGRIFVGNSTALNMSSPSSLMAPSPSSEDPEPEEEP